MSLGVKRGTVRIEAHSTRWKQDFEEEKARLLVIFGTDFLEIEHVGSTAIPGLIAKPLIDIAIKVSTLESTDQFDEALIKAGYVERKGRLKGRQKVYAKGGDSNVTHHLHIIEDGEQDYEDKIRFRDLLLSKPELAREYAELKKLLALENENNRGAYTTQKSSFIS